ncbi:MAG: glycine cleavage system aminomethyltransferase GcvT [Bacteroidales bacterium]|nr:glycine cleavage system aminomethyltransferase GcvT [Bacteroidales bacterium]MBN2697232.1 glycine cleavage system aminomethyltransferase GcvT [Bacteroidales bacterium]
MKRTVFYERHVGLGARIVPFAGFEMPVEYEGIRKEHINVRTNVGVFDVSHMGEIWVKGEGAAELVQKLTSNDIRKLEPGKIQYSCFPNGKGGIVDDLLVYQFGEDKYLLVVNAANIEKDYLWVFERNDTPAEVENASDKISQLAVQGPNALKVLQKLTPADLSGVPYYTFITGRFAGVDEVIISNTGYTGSGGFEIYFYNGDGPAIWDAVFDAGKETGIAPAGLAARDTLRLEMGYCLYGNDIDDTTSPIEAGLGWITKFTEGNRFTDRTRLEVQKASGVDRRLVGFELLEKGIPRQHYKITDPKGNEIGEVTSGTMSPMLNKGIGMGYVNSDHAREGTDIRILIRDKQVPAKVVRPPFYKPQ